VETWRNTNFWQNKFTLLIKQLE